MADAKITELTELTSAADADLLAIVDDVAGTPTTKKITLANIKAWIQAFVGDLAAHIADTSDAHGKEALTGLTTADSPQFAGVNIGHASDTTLGRASAGVLQVEGKKIIHVGNSGIQVARVSTGSISGGTSSTITVTWGTAWPDTNYDVVPCVFLDDTIQGPNLLVKTKTTTQCTVRVYNNAASAKTFELVCLGIDQ